MKGRRSKANTKILTARAVRTTMIKGYIVVVIGYAPWYICHHNSLLVECINFRGKQACPGSSVG